MQLRISPGSSRRFTIVAVCIPSLGYMSPVQFEEQHVRPTVKAAAGSCPARGAHSSRGSELHAETQPRCPGIPRDSGTEVDHSGSKLTIFGPVESPPSRHASRSRRRPHRGTAQTPGPAYGRASPALRPTQASFVQIDARSILIAAAHPPPRRGTRLRRPRQVDRAKRATLLRSARRIGCIG